MAEQLYKGPPKGMLPMDSSIVLRGWRYRKTHVPYQPIREPYYTFWVDGIDGFGTYPSKAVSLWWNGARWVVWVTNLFVAEATEFKDMALRISLLNSALCFTFKGRISVLKG